MENLTEYWNNLEFGYVKTYSGLQEIRSVKNTDRIHDIRIIDRTGKLHSSTVEVATFQKDHPFITQLAAILTIDFEEQHIMRCPPVFRDAVVFYHRDGKIVGILHICFGCDAVKNEKEESMAVDFKIFPKLENLLQSVKKQSGTLPEKPYWVTFLWNKISIFLNRYFHFFR